MECNCNYKVGIYKFVGVLPARMGEAMSEAQGRGSMWKVRLAMYVLLHSPASAAAYASCRVTLPLAKREGLYLCRAFARDIFFPVSKTKDGRECRSGGQLARERTSVAEQAVARG